MSDQAETLRRLMQWHNSRSEQTGPEPELITFTECGEPSLDSRSLRALQAGIGARFASEGARTLLVDYGMRGDEEPLYEDLGTGGGRGPWFVAVQPGWRKQAEPVSSDIDVILVSSYTRVERLPMMLYGPAKANVVVVGPDLQDQNEAGILIRELRQRAGVVQVGVIVKEVTNGSRGLEAFKRLEELMRHSIDADLEYLGYFGGEKKRAAVVRKPNFLLSLNQEERSITEVELLSKRVIEKYLNGRSFGSVTGRFKEEPARSAPGNTAKFWRTLLGEVKA